MGVVIQYTTVHIARMVVHDQVLHLKKLDTNVGLVSSLVVNMVVRIHVVEMKNLDTLLGLVIEYTVHNRILVVEKAIGIPHTNHSHQTTQTAKETWRL